MRDMPETIGQCFQNFACSDTFNCSKAAAVRHPVLSPVLHAVGNIIVTPAMFVFVLTVLVLKNVLRKRKL